MAANTPTAQDPMSLMRMVLAHRRVAQSPFAQLQEPGSDMLQANPMAKVLQGFKPQAAPLVPNGAPTQAPEVMKPPQGVEAPKGAPALRQGPPVMASSVPPPIEVQGPMPPTPFQNRLGDVTAALNDGTFDTTGANAQGANPKFTTFGTNMHGAGATPGVRFIDAAAKSAGVDPQGFNYDTTPGSQGNEDKHFIQSLTQVPINPERWDAMLEGTKANGNIEDRRDPNNLEGDQIGDLLREMDQRRAGGEAAGTTNGRQPKGEE